MSEIGRYELSSLGDPMTDIARVRMATALVLACVACPAPAQSRVPALSPAEWRADLRTLATELPRRHARVFHTTTRAEFDAAVAALDARIPSATPNQLVVGLAAIVASIGDGHTRLQLPTDWPRYAIVPGWFGCDPASPGPCELRVTRAAAGHEGTLGARVLAIDSVPVSEVHSRLSMLIPKAESEGAVWASSTSLIQLPNVLHGLGVVRDTASATFTLERASGETTQVVIGSVPRQSDVQGWATASAAEPLSRQRTAEPLWWTMLPDSHTVYLAFNSYPGIGAFRQTTKELVDVVASQGATRLIIDLRRNGGGDFTKVRETLLPAIARHPVLGVRGHFYVITGPQTFSAAMSNATDFRKDAHAILVGLPTGARPNGYQEGNQMTLPKSRLVVGYSTKYYRFQDEDTPGVIPDQRIEPTWAAFREGRDPAVEWILAQPIPGIGPPAPP
jgi:hypothetical protein